MRLFCHRFPKNSPPLQHPKLLLLHGLGGTGALWRPLAASLEERFQILAPDQRGHGGSQEPQTSYSPLDLGQDLVETLEAESFTPTWVLGHSLGVRSALALASLRPDLVQGLFLVDLGLSGPAGGGMGAALAQFLRQIPQEFKTRVDMRTYMERESPDSAIGLYLLAVSTRLPSGAQGFPFDREALLKILDAAPEARAREWLAEFAKTKKTVILFRGEQSHVWTKDEFEAEKQNFADHPHLKWLTFSGAGHGLPFEKRLELSEAIIKTVMEQKEHI
jgi:pimeloyl-ACP methyl ester carboxylesterase